MAGTVGQPSRVNVLVIFLGVVSALATLAVTVLILVFSVRMVRESWSRVPRERLPAARVGLAVLAGLLLADLVVMIVAPWGSRSGFYVLAGFAAIGFATLIAFYLLLLVRLFRQERERRHASHVAESKRGR
jgi:Na+/melibiose symporter-like transporter